MEKERFWVGTAIVVAPILLIMSALVPRSEVRRSGPVEGHVSIDGHPMAGGFIVFIPRGAEANTVVAPIDMSGHYWIRPAGCPLDPRGESRYRICLLPETGHVTPHPTPDAESPGTVRTNASDDLADIGAELRRRWSDPTTSSLEVRLVSGPAQVDIRL